MQKVRINLIEPVKVDYCHSCRVDYNSPEAYEQIILEAINNSSIFTRWDELEYSWKFERALVNPLRVQSLTFQACGGSKGPEEAAEL